MTPDWSPDREAVKLSPLDEVLYSRRNGQLVFDEAWLALLMGRGREATRLFEAAHRRRPDDPWRLRGLGLAFAEREIEVQAVTFLERAARIDPDHAETWYWIGQFAPRDTHAPLALKAFIRATELAPEDADFWAARAGREDDDAARASLARATDIDPENIEAWTTAAWVMRASGRTADEVDALRRLVSARPHPKTLRALATALRSVGDHDEAGAVAHQALTLEDEPPERPVGPTNGQAEFGLVASLWLERGQLETLRELYVDGAASEPAVSGFWWSFAGALAEIGRRADALAVLDQVVGHVDENPAQLSRLHRDRAILLESLERTDDAATAWALMRMHRDFARYERSGLSALDVGPYGGATVTWTTATANVADPWTRRVRPFQGDQAGA